MPDAHHNDTDPTKGYELRDVNVRVVMIGIFALVIICVGAVVATELLVNIWSRPPETGGAPAIADYGRLLPPSPRLQANPPEDMKEFLEQEDAILNSYGWINRETGVVRIPIDRAMEMVAEQGPPSWDESEASPSDDTAAAPGETPTDESGAIQ
jgi:hypothetical protein